MMISQNIVKALSFCALIILVCGCTAAPKKSAGYTSASGSITSLDNDQEACQRHCDVDFDRCGSTAAAESQVGRGQLTGVLGAKADCKDSMRTCMARCKAR